MATVPFDSDETDEDQKDTNKVQTELNSDTRKAG